MLQPLNKVVYSHDLTVDGKRFPFYVGIGSLSRAHYMRRNPYHANVVAKYGISNVSVTIWEHSLTMQDAADHEVELISFLKESGVRLTNLTVGGDGAVGYKWTPAQRIKKSGRNHPMFGKRHSAESRKKQSDKMKGCWDTVPHPQLGRVEDAAAKSFRIAKIISAWSKERREEQSLAMRGKGNPFFGREHSAATKMRISMQKRGMCHRSAESYAATGACVKGSKWVTNGEVSKRLYEPAITEHLSLGWWLGKTDKRGQK